VKCAAPKGALGKLALSPADFDAFLESRRQRSTARAVPAVQRKALRERMEAWARTVACRIEQLGTTVEIVVPDEVEQHLSSRAPRSIAQRVLFVRDAFARANVPKSDEDADPLRAHAYLALTIDSVHIEVALEICPEADADVGNLRARLADPTRLLELTTLFETLPMEFAIGVIGVPNFPRAEAANADDIRAILDDSQRNRRPLWVGWSVKREVALAHTAELDEQLADALVVLAHAYKLIAWTPDNDLIEGGKRGSWRVARARNEERRERGREERAKRRKPRSKKGAVRIEGTRREREDVRQLRVVAEREGTSETSGVDAVLSGPTDRRTDPTATRTPLGRRPVLQTTMRARSGRLGIAVDIDPRAPIEKGTRVRVLTGPFANKVGVVEELSAKGRARVRLGLLAATLGLEDLVASITGPRPVLGSSHRKPRSPR
jgi:hypothetical protein